ncbi:NAD(P)-dependent dehydrogenase (short-subunit alcohol dehydrogenase family) [Branchiibius hedensis]|uniref:NAD(P)-dependent dehydrogenase, short-chain alcohol dehydrogenase family n=1 Tax=Branchiibius hedensis TaxID=672460 RepID=A0A2Y8ZSW2_9MICO|nr:SDR family oxidoreductase [Branchiibius hedensis]PWJ26252.1 NAD(P)-dependent dehydrogenase (short-subunit alcohol dehydrogenase family) [Branchiibius hedensis]SSA35064.1 NAD(P)-dependent dehydrogenase, short-chain alcohol dehydrogenase family [Branchiibius hedensis]
MGQEGRLAGKVAVITGGASGFGRESALLFAQHGASVVVADVVEKPLAKGFEADLDTPTADAITAKGGRAVYVKCDVTKKADTDAAVAAAVSEFGRLDVMFNNAGIYRGGKLMDEFTEEDLDACFNVNAKGTFFGIQSAVAQFRKQEPGPHNLRGTIVNLVSTAGLQGHPMQSVYNISKGAQANVTRCAAIEYGAEGIRVNGICPTYAKTALTRDLYEDMAFMKEFSESVPMKRWGEMEDVANLALFLASDESSYVHGDLVRIDGGETLCRYSV